jgi:hypothetical protein
MSLLALVLLIIATACSATAASVRSVDDASDVDASGDDPPPGPVGPANITELCIINKTKLNALSPAASAFRFAHPAVARHPPEAAPNRTCHCHNQMYATVSCMDACR